MNGKRLQDKNHLRRFDRPIDKGVRNQTLRMTLKIRARDHPHGNWQMRIVVLIKLLIEQVISCTTVEDEWLDYEVYWLDADQTQDACTRWEDPNVS